MPEQPTLTAAQYRRLERALAQLNALAEELGDRWDDYEFDDLANARGLLRGVGLVNGGELRGVAVWSRPISIEVQRKEPRTGEIIRVCTIGDKNANSRLYAALCRAAAALGYKSAITYTRPDESGASLRAAGFTPDEGEYGSREGQQWHSRVQRLWDEDDDTSGPKIRWRRSL